MFHHINKKLAQIAEIQRREEMEEYRKRFTPKPVFDKSWKEKQKILKLAKKATNKYKTIDPWKRFKNYMDKNQDDFNSYKKELVHLVNRKKYLDYKMNKIRDIVKERESNRYYIFNPSEEQKEWKKLNSEWIKVDNKIHKLMFIVYWPNGEYKTNEDVLKDFGDMTMRSRYFRPISEAKIKAIYKLIQNITSVNQNETRSNYQFQNNINIRGSRYNLAEPPNPVTDEYIKQLKRGVQEESGIQSFTINGKTYDFNISKYEGENKKCRGKYVLCWEKKDNSVYIKKVSAAIRGPPRDKEGNIVKNPDFYDRNVFYLHVFGDEIEEPYDIKINRGGDIKGFNFDEGNIDYLLKEYNNNYGVAYGWDWFGETRYEYPRSYHRINQYLYNKETTGEYGTSDF